MILFDFGSVCARAGGSGRDYAVPAESTVQGAGGYDRKVGGANGVGNSSYAGGRAGRSGAAFDFTGLYGVADLCSDDWICEEVVPRHRNASQAGGIAGGH